MGRSLHLRSLFHFPCRWTTPGFPFASPCYAAHNYRLATPLYRGRCWVQRGPGDSFRPSSTFLDWLLPSKYRRGALGNRMGHSGLSMTALSRCQQKPHVALRLVRSVRQRGNPPCLTGGKAFNSFSGSIAQCAPILVTRSQVASRISLRGETHMRWRGASAGGVRAL